MRKGLAEMVGFLTGYLLLHFLYDAPSWGACIGGWVLAMWISLGIRK